MNCLSCTASLPSPFLLLGETPLANSYVTESDISHESWYPLNVAFCEKCYLVQLVETVDPTLIYVDYPYLSSYSESFLQHTEDLVNSLDLTLKPRSVLEIGSNDGYLLKFFKQRNIRMVGVEPAKNIAKIAEQNGIPTVTRFFNDNTSHYLLNSYGKFDLIIGNNVFAHVPNINEFIVGCVRCLATKGTMVFEFPYIVQMITYLEFDTIYHEHVFYYSVMSLQNLFARHGLELVNIEFLNIHGGSLRIYVQYKNTSPVNSIVSYYVMNELTLGINRLDYYLQFADNVKKVADSFSTKLMKLKEKGHSIGAYGAPAKACTLLNYSSVGKDLLDFTVDINPNKQHKLLPGTHIPIYPLEYLIEKQPDYCVVLAWNIYDTIKEQQKLYVERGGQYILPLSD